MSALHRLLARALPALVLLNPAALLTAADIGAAVDGVSTHGFRALVAADRTATPLLAPASKEGEIRLKQFKHVPALKVNLWAAEPMLANPVAFSVDEKGRVFTAETYRYRTSVLDIRHYMFMLEDDLASRTVEDRLATIRKWFGPDGEQALGTETEVIRLIEDTNGDGVADKSSVYADGFTSPLSGIVSGVLARHGEVWVTEIPSLWKFRGATASELDTLPKDKPGLTLSHAPAGREAALSSHPHSPDRKVVAEELLTGFGIRFSYTGHDLHGLKLGPDGRLYFSCGDRGAHIVTREGTVIDLPDEGAVFRCETDGSHLEVVHRGLRNPQELAFNEYGDLFTGDNDSDQGDRERWVQVIEGADSGWRVGHQHAPLGNAGMWNMERLWVPHFEGQAAYLFPPIANIGDGPSGLVFDATHAYGKSGIVRTANADGSAPTPRPDSADTFLLAYFKGTSAKSGVYALTTQPKGAGYELIGHDEFVWNALVPDVDLAPDGAVFFADWHEGWPKSNKGRLYRAFLPEVINNPVMQQTARLLGEGMTNRTESALLALLAFPDMRVRQEAQFELAGRGPKSFDGLKAVAFESKNQFARIHAIWGIGQLLRRSGDADLQRRSRVLADLLVDTDPEVQANGIRLWGLTGMSNFSEEVCALSTNANPRVAVAALSTYPGMFRHGTYIPDLFEKLSLKLQAWRKEQTMDLPKGVHVERTYGNGLSTDLVEAGLTNGLFADPIVRQARVNALTEIGAFGFKMLFALADTNRESPVRLLGLLARRNLRDDSVSIFFSDPDPLLVLEAARAINDVPITNAMPALAELAEPSRLDALLKQFATLKPSPTPVAAPGSIRDVRSDQPLPWGDAPVDQLTPMLLRIVNANFRIGTPETARRLAMLATRTDLSETVRAEAVRALAHWPAPPARDLIVGTFRPLPARDDAPAREALAQVLPKLLTPSAGEILITATAEASATLRLSEAVSGLAALVNDSAAPSTARAAALRAYVALEPQKPAVEALLALATRDPAEPLRLAASRLNAELNPDDAAGQLAGKLTEGSIAEQQSAYASLGGLKSEAADAVLADALDRLMKRDVANEVMLDLVLAASQRDAAAVKSRLAAYQDWKLPKDDLSPYRETLYGGDAARGRKIFYENAAVACTRCHQIGGDGGGNAGPKLDGLASRTTRESLLESVVFPNQSVVQGFESAMITLKDGQTYAGVVKSENDTELVVISPEEGDVTLKKSTVETREKGLSGMPDGLGSLLTPTELRDVIEFLGTLR